MPNGPCWEMEKGRLLSQDRMFIKFTYFAGKRETCEPGYSYAEESLIVRKSFYFHIVSIFFFTLFHVALFRNKSKRDKLFFFFLKLHLKTLHIERGNNVP